MLFIMSICVLSSLNAVFAGPGAKGNNGEQVLRMPLEDLSDQERQGLLLMREEEKLARDVYTALYDRWRMKIFTNISRSEQQHTGRVKDLLDKYSISDPVAGLKPGEFVSVEFKNLYDSLVAQGTVSLVEALKVGATIEDLDIRDLNELLAGADNEDIKWVYGNLLRGSRNHIRSFVRQLENNGVQYVPLYIDHDELEEILQAPMERGGS